MAPLTRDKTFAERQRELQGKAREENGGQRTSTTCIPLKLYDQSAPYRAYIKLQRLPVGAPNYAYFDNGYPIIHLGEYICRMPGAQPHSHCGQKVLKHLDLPRHMERVHKITTDLRPSGFAGGRSMGRKLAHGFYLVIMQTEEYEGKAEARRQHQAEGLLEHGTNLLRLGSQLRRDTIQARRPEDSVRPEQTLQSEEANQPEEATQPEEVDQSDNLQQQEVVEVSTASPEEAPDPGYTGHIKHEVPEPTGSAVQPEQHENVIDLVSSPEPEVAGGSMKLEADLAQELKQDHAHDSRKRGRSATYEEDSNSDDEDIEVELRKTKLQLKELELERRLRRKRRKA